MTGTIDFIFDFASPNAYFAYKVLPQLAVKHGAHIRYIPCLLGGIFKSTGNQAPFIAFGNVAGKLDYERVEIERFIQKHGLSEFRMNASFPVNTLMLMRCAVVAQNNEMLEAYINIGMRAMWEDNLKMDDPLVFAKVMNDAGWDGAALLAAANTPSVKAVLRQNTEAAVTRGCFGIPTFYIGDDMFFGKDKLGQIDEMLALGGGHERR